MPDTPPSRRIADDHDRHLDERDGVGGAGVDAHDREHAREADEQADDRGASHVVATARPGHGDHRADQRHARDEQRCG
jgi:hypothetical protein